MKSFLVLAALLPLLPACQTTGASMTAASPVPVASATTQSELAFGTLWIAQQGQVMGTDGMASAVSKKTGWNVVPLASEAQPRGVDVIVKVWTKGGVIQTFSVRSGKQLSTGQATMWSYPGLYRDVANHLLAEFGANTELYKSMVAEKQAGRPAPVAAAPPAETGLVVVPSRSFTSDVEMPTFKLGEDESKFALVVGVENYQNVPKAEHAVRDARAVKAHLLAAGYPERNIIYLTDQLAGKSSLEKYLDAWLPRNVAENSTVLFYFSGHGSPDTEKGDAYLMPWDADAKFTESTGYPVKKLYAKLNALKAKKILVAMDACFSGSGARSVIGKGLRPLVAKVDDGGGVVGRAGALTASASDEVTGADEVSGHGLFTYQLLKAINARAGKATLKELFDALSPKVRDAARRDNRDQTPQLLGHGEAAL